MTYRLLTDEEVINQVNPVLAIQGHAQLNIAAAKVVGAFDESGRLVESLTLQLFPILGPMVRHDNIARDSGETTRGLVSFMEDYLKEANARGFLTIADSPFTQRLCERYRMKKVDSPVYMQVPTEDLGRVQ